MKRVSFKVAKALKEVGCPIEIKSIEEAEKVGWQDNAFYTGTCTCSLCPYAMEVWLWLWREKKIAIPADYFGYDNNYWSSCVPIDNGRFEFFEPLRDPEEAIIAAIEYLVDNALIK